MAADYKYNSALVASYLDMAHSTHASQLRQDLFHGENQLLAQLVSGKNILIVGSGLGHDSFALAPFAKHITGVEILPEFIEIANTRLQKIDIDNISFLQGDITTFTSSTYYDVVVLNMGTIGNFDDKEAIINTLLGLGKIIAFGFREPNLHDVPARLEMYKIEGGKFTVDGTTIKEIESGMESTCTSKEELIQIAENAGKKISFNKITHSYYVAIIQ